MEIKPVASQEEWEQACAIREKVFIDEQDCPPDEEWDGWDDRSRHLLGIHDDEPIAVARWRAVPHQEEVVAKLERFAVLSQHRGQGYGRQLVEYALYDARQAGFDTFLLHAQTHLEAFYASLGFETIGEPFEEAGIPHVKMVKRDAS